MHTVVIVACLLFLAYLAKLVFECKRQDRQEAADREAQRMVRRAIAYHEMEELGYGPYGDR